MRNGWRPASEAACMLHDIEVTAKIRKKAKRDADAAQAKADNYTQPGNKK